METLARAAGSPLLVLLTVFPGFFGRTSFRREYNVGKLKNNYSFLGSGLFSFEGSVVTKDGFLESGLFMVTRGYFLNIGISKRK